MRAREAKAKVDARRAERDERISQVQTEFFVALAEREAAEAAIAEAEVAMATAVQSLTSGDLKVSIDDAADLCELSAAEVRAFKKRDLPSVDHDGDGDGDGDTADPSSTDEGTRDE